MADISNKKLRKPIDESCKDCGKKTLILNADGICSDCQEKGDRPQPPEGGYAGVNEEPEGYKCNKCKKVSSKPFDSQGLCTDCIEKKPINKLGIILGATVALSVIVGAVLYFDGEEKRDTVPDKFLFQKQENVDQNIALNSNEIQVSGIDTPTSIKIDNGKYSIDDQDWTNQESTVGNGAKVKVQHTTSQDFNDSVSTTLNIGGVKGIFLSHTVAKDTTPDNFVFNKKQNVEPNIEVVSNEITISGINTEVSISIKGGQYSINGGAWTRLASRVSNSSKVKVRHKSAANSNEVVSTILFVGGVQHVFESVTKNVDVEKPGCTDRQRATHLNGC